MTQYRIFATVCGGVTASRSAYLKDADGKPATFPTLDAAEAEAQHLMRRSNGPHAKAFYYYRPVLFADDKPKTPDQWPGPSVY